MSYCLEKYWRTRLNKMSLLTFSLLLISCSRHKPLYEFSMTVNQVNSYKHFNFKLYYFMLWHNIAMLPIGEILHHWWSEFMKYSVFYHFLVTWLSILLIWNDHCCYYGSQMCIYDYFLYRNFSLHCGHAFCHNWIVYNMVF